MRAQIGDLRLESGATLRGVELAFTSHGRLGRDGRNAVLLGHGYTSSHLFADAAAEPEWSWAALVGPGRAVDTDRFFVVSSNMLGSSYGSTSPQSIAPATGRAYGPDFPRLTVGDIVAAQRRLLDGLGVRELAAVVGPSYGGFQAFEWGVAFPDFVRALVCVTTAPKGGGALHLDELRRRLAADPRWNGGRYQPGDLAGTLGAIREDMLRRYGVDAVLAARGGDLGAMARRWAAAFDPHSLLVLGAAAESFDVTGRLDRLRARVLLVLATTDELFPARLAPAILGALRSAGAEATYEELDSPFGHMAPGLDAVRWAPALARFLGAG